MTPFITRSLLLLVALPLAACAGRQGAAAYPHRQAIDLAYKACKRLNKSKLRLPLKTDVAAQMKTVRGELVRGDQTAAKARAEALAYACTTEARAREDIDELVWQLGRKQGRLDLRGYARFKSLVRARAYSDAMVCGESLLRGIAGRCSGAKPADTAPKAQLPTNLRAAFDVRSSEKRAGIGVEPKQKTRPMRLWGWIAAGAGGAMLLTGAILGGLASAQHSDLEDKCPPDCPTDEIDRGESLAVGADVLFGIGGAVAVTGGVLLFLDYSGALEKKEWKPGQAPAASAGTTRGITNVSFSPTGISLSGRF
jgi:hypothetical protein